MKKILLLIFFALFIVFTPLESKAAGKCFCASDLSNYNPAEAAKYSASCYPAATTQDCDPAKLKLTNFVGMKCELKQDDPACSNAAALWATEIVKLSTKKEEKAVEKSQGFQGSIMPDCVLNDTLTVSPECRDASIFIVTLINVGRYLFSIIGALALVMFIYGGFLMIISRGNSEQVKKGTGAMVAAVTGLIIAFGGYVLIKFLGDAIGVSTF